jgi:hypothetical protein
MSRPTSIKKILSANDIGSTGAHQAGILVPKAPEILTFFPTLDGSIKNPRLTLHFFEEDDVTKWPFEFIYYNNRFFGGTRNEYRLTCMTHYLRAKDAAVGEEIEFSANSAGRRYVRILRERNSDVDEDGVLRLSGGWKVITVR